MNTLENLSINSFQVGDVIQFAGNTRLKKVSEGFYKVTNVTNDIVTFKKLSESGNAIGKEYSFNASSIIQKFKNGNNWDFLLDEYNEYLNGVRIIRESIKYKESIKVLGISSDQEEIIEIKTVQSVGCGYDFINENKKLYRDKGYRLILQPCYEITKK